MTKVVSEQGQCPEKSGRDPESKVQVGNLGPSLPSLSDPPADTGRCTAFLHPGLQINDRGVWQRWAEGNRIKGV